MTVRELVVLGTSSHSPTRERNHNGYLLRWDGDGILFDPGEGTQRQMSFAEVSPALVNRICITHFHGDHCFGLPGVLMRLTQDQVTHPVDIHYPAAGQVYLERLRHASVGVDAVDLRERPITGPGVIATTDSYTLTALPLRHTTDTFGYRLEEPSGRRMLTERLDALDITGPDIGRLIADGHLTLPDGRTVTHEEVSEEREGQVVAYLLDTAWCDEALELARGADLLICEATFCDEHTDMAERFGHLTARQAGRLATEAGARRLVITHFSQRYRDDGVFLAEASEEHDDVVLAHDLDRIPVPPRR